MRNLAPRSFAIALALLFPAVHAQAQTLRADHPLIGTWVITAPNGCAESYSVRADGMATITSADEVAESQLTVSDQASQRGFFKWTEKVVKDNGKKDCSGQLGEVGRVNVAFIFLNQDKSQFAMCEREDRRACIGPFVRK